MAFYFLKKVKIFLFFLFFFLMFLHPKNIFACCSQDCGFGYTCVGIPNPCPGDITTGSKEGSCQQSQTECDALNPCGSGFACVDYVCVSTGGGGGGGGGGGAFQYPDCGNDLISCESPNIYLQSVDSDGNMSLSINPKCTYKATCGNNAGANSYFTAADCTGVNKGTCQVNCKCCPVGQIARYTDNWSAPYVVVGTSCPAPYGYAPWVQQIGASWSVTDNNIYCLRYIGGNPDNDCLQWSTPVTTWYTRCKQNNPVLNCTLTVTNTPTPTFTPTPTPYLRVRAMDTAGNAVSVACLTSANCSSSTCTLGSCVASDYVDYPGSAYTAAGQGGAILDPNYAILGVTGVPNDGTYNGSCRLRTDGSKCYFPLSSFSIAL